jgi:hypothetical protein
MRTSIVVLSVLLLGVPAVCQEIPGQSPADQQPKLKQRTEIPGKSPSFRPIT